LSNVRDVLRVLRNLKETGHDQWLASCPSHEDDTPSLSIADRGGKILLYCFAGCDYERIVESLEGVGVKLRQTRKDFWQTRYEYYDQKGNPLGFKSRRTYMDGSKRILSTDLKEGIKIRDVLYQIDTVLSGDPDEKKAVFVVEGEKACDELWAHGLMAVGTLGASTVPTTKTLALLGTRKVILWPDNDEPGRKQMSRISRELEALKIKHTVFDWKHAPKGGDAWDWFALGNTVKDLRKEFKAKRKKTPEYPSGVVVLSTGLEGAIMRERKLYKKDFRDCVTTGLRSLDARMEGGFKKQKVYLWAAPTGGGKTTLMQQFAETAAHTNKGAVLFLSPEMDVDELARRSIAKDSMVPSWHLNPWNTDADAETKSAAMLSHEMSATHLGKEKFMSRILTLDDPRSKMTHAEEAALLIPDLCMIVLDYAQILAERRQGLSGWEAIKEVSERAVSMAQDNDVPVLLSSQLRENKDTSKFDPFTLKGASDLKDPVHMMFMFLPTDDEGISRVVCTKNRSGSLFKLDVSYMPGQFRITDRITEGY
jgi:5S rRNA maturation endonuclease (ribonuclease M5)/energy-coupling factor transporter ATP-binding protein EcfA2